MNDPGSGPFEPAAILAALQEHAVDYVLIGGAASVLHGAPTTTTDLDVVPERSSDNIDRLVACLRELQALRTTEVDSPPTLPSANDLKYRIEQFDSPVGAIDIVMEANRVGGYERLIGQAQRMDLEGTGVLVASLDDLIMAKQWSDRPKDRTHLRLLIAVKNEMDDDPGASD